MWCASINIDYSYNYVNLIRSVESHCVIAVVKQRIQMYNSPYKSILDCIVRVYRTEGPTAFYRSYTTQLAMNLPFQVTIWFLFHPAGTLFLLILKHRLCALFICIPIRKHIQLSLPLLYGSSGGNCIIIPPRIS